MSLSGHLSDPRGLILAAFATARATGKENWREMTTPVLKNRLLKLTAKAFDERVFTSDGMRGFVNLYPDLLELDTGRAYPVARLIWEGDLEVSQPTPAYEVVPDELRQSVVSRSTDPRLISDLLEGRTIFVEAEWHSDHSRRLRRRLAGAMRRRSRRLRSGAVTKDGLSGTLLWTENP